MIALPPDTLFRCSTCRGGLDAHDDGYRCAQGHLVPTVAGVPDFVPSELRDETWEVWEQHLEAFQRRRDQRTEKPADLTARVTARGGQQQAFADFITWSGDTVLDIGCGPGQFRRQLPEGARYVGIDPIPLLPSVLEFEFGRAVSERLPFEDDAFSDVVVLHALDHVKDVDATLREIARVLRPTGRLHVLQNVLDKRHVVRWLAHEAKDFLEDRRDPHRHEDTPHHMAEFTTDSLRSALGGAMRITDERYWAPNWFSPRRLMVTGEPR